MSISRTGVSESIRHLPSLSKTAAIVASIAAMSEPAAEAADLTFDSGPIVSSGNVIGWAPPTAYATFFPFQTTQGRAFNFAAFAYTDGTAGYRMIVAALGNMNTSTFVMATNAATRNSLANGAQFFNLGQTWNDRGGSKREPYLGIISNENVQGGVDPERDVYFLFKFEDNGTPYYGWIDADIKVSGPNFSNGDIYVRINRYAWQSSTLGVLGAGVTPVPEPSTVVTSGIAALAGGAVALRRWRKERKAKTEAA